MYVCDLDGAKPVTFKIIDILCPPDCGGKDEDKVEYAAFCPVCNHQFDNLDRDNFCRNCGTKLYWPVKWPVLN